MQNVILCACGCGNPVKIAKFPSQQTRFINTHQHKGALNGNYRGGKKGFACPICGDNFFNWESQRPVTCGKDACYRKWQGIVSASRGQNKVSVSCFECSNEIKMYPSQVAKQRNYCSQKCTRASHGKIYKGANAKNWKGGGDTYARQKARARDENKCVVCGFDLVVDVHHIIERAEGGTNDLSNLITLCPNHHRLAHMGVVNLEEYRKT